MDSLRGHTAVLYDAFPLWLDAVEKAVEKVGVEVVGRASDRAAMRKLLDEKRPDILVADLWTDGDKDGGVELSGLTSRHPRLRVIALSSVDDKEQRVSAFIAGAAAFVLKTAYPDDVALAVRQAFDHSIFFANSYNAVQAVAPRPKPELAHDLTRREIEILQLVAEGHSNSKLAAMLWVTEQTIKFHLSNIYRKLGVTNRTEASRWAQINGLLPLVAPQYAA